jgi:short-subunit dehydrogenase
MKTISGKEQERLLNNYGKWAVVTGASSGIGLALTKQLAAAGFNLVVCARGTQALKMLRNQLMRDYKTAVLVVSADLSTERGVEDLIQATYNLPVGLFIASAGFGTSGLFHQSELKTEVNMLRVNAEALLQLTHHFAHRFVAEQKGGIILLSSLVGFQGTPYAAHYAATKAYVQSLAEALAVELQPYKVDVLAAAPVSVHSGFEARMSMKIGNALNPDDISIPILEALGKTHTVHPGRLTKVLIYSLRTVPLWAKVRIMEKVMKGIAAPKSSTTTSVNHANAIF